MFRLKPDIVVETPGGPTVLDTTWKRLDPADKTLSIDSADIYQMQAYAHAYGAARLVLVYPWLQGKSSLVREFRSERLRGADG